VRTISGATVAVDYTVTPMFDRTPPELLIEIQPLDRLLRINRDDHHASVQATTRKLVRGLAHEIKNPLGGIRGAAQLLQRELQSERQRDYTRIIIEEADRLRNLVDRMLGPSQRPRRCRSMCTRLNASCNAGSKAGESRSCATMTPAARQAASSR
jgi:two-component system nitrogen regulation sensor histidine kinase GlnL